MSENKGVKVIFFLKHISYRAVFVGISIFLLLGSFPCVAQKSKAQLERERKQNLRKIAETDRILKETAKKKEATLGQLNAISQQIQSRAEQINYIKSEIRLLDTEVLGLSQIVFAMESDISRLQQEYGAMVYAAAKSSSQYNKLLFIFSADTFYQFFMRIRYMQQYAQMRKLQINHIQRMQGVLNEQRVKMELKKQEKNRLLQSQLFENENLVLLKTQQDDVVRKLSEQEKELTEELEASRQAIANLERLISDLVEEERRRAAAEESSTGTKNTASSGITSSFAMSRSKLAWPVNSGFISSKFGEQPHPVLKGIKVNNNGVGIQTNKGEEVRAVYDGEVWTVATIPGLNKLVMVKHGDYVTVYAKLGKVVVKEGQQVKAKQVLGEVYTEKDGTSELQFQIWKEQEKLDPQRWLQDR